MPEIVDSVDSSTLGDRNSIEVNNYSLMTFMKFTTKSPFLISYINLIGLKFDIITSQSLLLLQTPQ